MYISYLSVLHDQGQLLYSSSLYLWESSCKTLVTGFDPRFLAHYIDSDKLGQTYFTG
jgi:hypothetical protein